VDRELELDTRVELFVLCHMRGRLVACAGLDHNVIKCVAVAPEFSGEGLSLHLGTEIVALATEKGRFHLFLYSAPRNVDRFRGWGFYPIVEVPGLVVLLENSPTALWSYSKSLRLQREPGRRIGSAVINADPFTLGHRHLIERAAADCEWVHVFVVKENASTFSYSDRLALVAAGVEDIPNVTLHPGSEYIISRATFPGYFLKERAIVDHSWAAIDLLLFREHIAPSLNITHRYVGTEPLDAVTSNYNLDMKRWLQEAPSREHAIEVMEVRRALAEGTPISASAVRKLFAEGDFVSLKTLVPESTWTFLKSEYEMSTIPQN
jgi:[citrate (pro-3S)-lyase] ligase